MLKLTQTRVRILLTLGMCLLVFCFGLNAKLSLYQGQTTQSTSVTASKLPNGDKMQVQISASVLGVLLITMMAWSRPKGVPPRVCRAYRTPSPVFQCLFQPELFRRPPPSRA